MAEIALNTNTQKGRRRAKRLSTTVDFTPMVDLGFLLITFFMLTTSLRVMSVLPVSVPQKGDPSPIPASKTLTLLLGADNKIAYYFGEETQNIQHTTYGKKGLRKLLASENRRRMPVAYDHIMNLRLQLKNKQISAASYKEQVNKLQEENEGLMVIIKNDEAANLGNMVDVLDEMEPCAISRYYIDDISKEEKQLPGVK